MTNIRIVMNYMSKEHKIVSSFTPSGLTPDAIRTVGTAVLDLAPTGKSLALALTALNTAAGNPRVHHPCLTAADTPAAG